MPNDGEALTEDYYAATHKTHCEHKVVLWPRLRQKQVVDIPPPLLMQILAMQSIQSVMIVASRRGGVLSYNNATTQMMGDLPTPYLVGVDILVRDTRSEYYTQYLSSFLLCICSS